MMLLKLLRSLKILFFNITIFEKTLFFFKKKKKKRKKQILASLVAQLVKNLPAMRETQVQSLGGEDPLEKGMATHSSILA